MVHKSVEGGNVEYATRCGFALMPKRVSLVSKRPWKNAIRYPHSSSSRTAHKHVRKLKFEDKREGLEDMGENEES